MHTPQEWDAGPEDPTSDSPLLHSIYPRAISGDLWNDKDRKGGSDREEACIGHPRVSKHLIVDDSRQHVMLSRNPSASLTQRCLFACTRPPERQSVICQYFHGPRVGKGGLKVAFTGSFCRSRKACSLLWWLGGARLWPAHSR